MTNSIDSHTSREPEPAGTSREPAGSIALALGPAIALLVAGLLAGVRDDIGTTNVALTLACVVVLAALAGRRAGVATALMASISFNFFHTQPYRSLRINDGKDILTVTLLAVLGVVVSETAQRRRSANQRARSLTSGEHALELVASRLVHDPSPQAVWSEIELSLVEMLDLAECQFEPGDTCDLPILPRSGSLLSKTMHLGREGFQLPESGAAVQVRYGTHTYGHIRLVPRGGAGSSVETRRMAIALADLYAVTLALAE
jgi:K+-sensing histidine kinase KdpD